MADLLSFATGVFAGGALVQMWNWHGPGARILEVRKQADQPPQLSGHVRNAAQALVDDGKFIEAVKLVRDQSGMDLKQAKDAVSGLG
jgi:hypothetical protein